MPPSPASACSCTASLSSPCRTLLVPNMSTAVVSIGSDKRSCFQLLLPASKSSKSSQVKSSRTCKSSVKIHREQTDFWSRWILTLDCHFFTVVPFGHGVGRIAAVSLVSHRSALSEKEAMSSTSTTTAASKPSSVRRTPPGRRWIPG